MNSLVDYLVKLSPLLISGFALYLSYQNRSSKLREILYEKQYGLILQLNQKIVDIEAEIQMLIQWVQKKNENEIILSKTNYANLLHDIIRIVELEGNLILPEKIIQSTKEIVSIYSELLPEIINTSNQLDSNDLFMNRLKLFYLWQNIIRDHIGIEKLTKANNKIIG